jgi:ubiquinone biosynthesis protein UbiJ
MALTNAEKQAAYRKRLTTKAAKVDKLKALVDKLKVKVAKLERELDAEKTKGGAR